MPMINVQSLQGVYERTGEAGVSTCHTARQGVITLRCNVKTRTGYQAANESNYIYFVLLLRIDLVHHDWLAPGVQPLY